MLTNWDLLVDQAYAELKDTLGGQRNDYFGLVYLEKEYQVPREQAVRQVAFGNNDFGIDGFHVDVTRRNLYLFQFKYSKDYRQFKVSIQRMIDQGIEYLFGGTVQFQNANQLLRELKSRIREDKALIDRVYIYLVFLGSIEDARSSQVLDKLTEDLQSKRFWIEQFFGRPIEVIIEYRSILDGPIPPPEPPPHSYDIGFQNSFSVYGPQGEILSIGLIPLFDLVSIYKAMGSRFFDRNIRSGLGDKEYVNKTLKKAFRRVLLERKDDPRVFPFFHNGVSLSAEKLELTSQGGLIVEPRLLNGAQTVTTFAEFIKENEGNITLENSSDWKTSIKVLCKIITQAKPDFITTTTINNNRQTPVEPWNLRANDLIQLELQDKFRDDLRIYYERQENAFSALSDEDLEQAGIYERKAIEMLPLTQTFLVSDGEIDKITRIRDVFEDDSAYERVFSQNRLKVDSRRILLCYKVQFRLRKLMQVIAERGVNKYAYISKARLLLWALLCQALLNDDNLEDLCENYGNSLSVEPGYTELLSNLAARKCRFVISDVVEDAKYAERVSEGNYSFLRTNMAFSQAMAFAYKRYGWVHRKLK